MCSDRFAPSVVVLNDRTLSLSQTTAVLTSGLERIPDQLGYLVISEDGVLAVSVRCVLTGFPPRSRDGEPASFDRLFEEPDQ